MGNLVILKNTRIIHMAENTRTSRQINKKKKFVADGVFHAELHEFLGRILAEQGYGGMEVRSSETSTLITIKIVKKDDQNQKEFQRQANELTSLVQKRYGFEENQVTIKFDPIRVKGQSASAQAEMLKTKLLKGVAVRSAALSIINTVMKYKAGYLISTGQPKQDYIDTAIRHCFFKQGIIGVKVRIMLPYDPTGKKGVRKPLPDMITIHPAKEDDEQDVYPTQAPVQQTTQPPAEVEA